MASSEPTVDLVKVMAVAFGAKPLAVWAMISHGQVYIDGHCIRREWVDHWTAEQLQGRILKCPKGEYRLIGGRLVRDFEQMRLA